MDEPDERSFSLLDQAISATPDPTGKPTSAAIAAASMRIDALIDAQSALLLQHPALLAMEARWRGLAMLAQACAGSDTYCRIWLLDCRKSEIARDLNDHRNGDSLLDRRVIDDELETLGGVPFTCLLGDFPVDRSAEDMQFLKDIADIAARAHCLFIAAPAPGLFGMASFDREDIALRAFEGPDAIKWNAFRDNPDSAYVALVFPSLEARPGCAINGGYTLALHIARTFIEEGVYGDVLDGGGTTEFELPDWAEGKPVRPCPALSTKQADLLAKNGILSVRSGPTGTSAWFTGAATVRRATRYHGGGMASGDAERAAQLPFILASSHFLTVSKVIVFGTFGSIDFEDSLQRWIDAYVGTDRPLRSAKVSLSRDLGDWRIELRIAPALYGTGLSRPVVVTGWVSLG